MNPRCIKEPVNIGKEIRTGFGRKQRYEVWAVVSRKIGSVAEIRKTQCGIYFFFN